VTDTLVADLGLPPEVWLILTVVSCLALCFKFDRFWSIRNLDLVLLFALTPGLVRLVGRTDAQPWGAFAWLFAGSAVWFARCLLDLGLVRRPLLEPNLNAGGLACFLAGLLGLVLVETVILPGTRGAARNPSDPHARQARPDGSATAQDAGPTAVVHRMLRRAPRPAVLKRIAAALGHLGISLGLIFTGARHFGRPTIGLAMAVAYLILPYSRIALLDSGQLVPAALLTLAVLAYRRPLMAGLQMGLAAIWIPAVAGLLPLWAGFYWGAGARRFLSASIALVVLGIVGGTIPPLADFGRGLGARSLAEAGLLPTSEAPSAGSFWAGVEPAYRLPVLVLYVALVGVAAYWPAGKDMAQLIALSAGLLVASQFWYLDEGGTLVVLYLPLLLMMVFRPNLSTKRPPPLGTRRRAEPAFAAA
jgi:hypothetical protein